MFAQQVRELLEIFFGPVVYGILYFGMLREVVVEDVPDNTVVAGVPARAIKRRDEKTDSKTGLEEGLRQL